jgi:NTE family protein
VRALRRGSGQAFGISRRAALAGSAALVLPACTLDPDRDHAEADAPRALPLTKAFGIAWVLGSGGPRGFTHVGVLRALDELGLAPDLIVGASVGAMVGALRASGRRAQDIEALALDLNVLSFARLAVGTSERYSGAPIAELVHVHAAEQQLERMPTAMACVAVRRGDRGVVAFTAGRAGLAVQASSAIEGQFAPVRIRGETYVDPDWDMPLPVRVARSLGARKVMAVDASVHVDRAPDGAARYRESDARKKALIDADASLADLVLKPDFGYWVNFSRDFRERAIGAGYREAMAQAQALRELHA